MKQFLVAILVLVCAASICYAAEGDAPKANEPVGAAVEATSTFVGKVVSVVTEGAIAGNAATVTVVNDTGKAMKFPVDSTVKIVDAAVNTVTLNQLKQGDKVSVEYSKDASGKEKAEAINVVQ